MSTIEVMLSARDLLGDVLIPDYAEARLMETMMLGMIQIEDYAKSHHRFKSRTGTLINSIRSEVYGLSGRIFIDDYISSYGVYVHEGQRSWAPDPFIYNAVRRLLPELKMELHVTLQEVEDEMGEEVTEVDEGFLPPVSLTPKYPGPKVTPGKIPLKIPKVPELNIKPEIGMAPKAPKPGIPPKSKEVLPKTIKSKAKVPDKKDYLIELLLISRLLREEENKESKRLGINGN